MHKNINTFLSLSNSRYLRNQALKCLQEQSIFWILACAGRTQNDHGNIHIELAGLQNYKNFSVDIRKENMDQPIPEVTELDVVKMNYI